MCYSRSARMQNCLQLEYHQRDVCNTGGCARRHDPSSFCYDFRGRRRSNIADIRSYFILQHHPLVFVTRMLCRRPFHVDGHQLPHSICVMMTDVSIYRGTSMIKLNKDLPMRQRSHVWHEQGIGSRARLIHSRLLAREDFHNIIVTLRYASCGDLRLSRG